METWEYCNVILFKYNINIKWLSILTLNIKLSNSQLSKLKSGIENSTEVTLNLLLDMIGDSNDETNFLQKLLLTNTQVSKTRKAVTNGSLMLQLGKYFIDFFIPLEWYIKHQNLQNNFFYELPNSKKQFCWCRT